MLEKQNKDFDKFVKMDNPFEPKMRPMFINLVKEANEYKVIRYKEHKTYKTDLKRCNKCDY